MSIYSALTYPVSQPTICCQQLEPLPAGEGSCENDNYVECRDGFSACNDNELHSCAGSGPYIVEPKIEYSAIARILHWFPESDPSSEFDRHEMDANIQNLNALISGALTYPRLDALISLLSGEKGRWNTRIVDNATGPFPVLAVAAAMIGCHTLVKEIDDKLIRWQEMYLRRHLPPSLASKISHVKGGLDAVNFPSPADIVFWTNPSPRICADGKIREWHANDYEIKDFLGTYLGRDVRPGGYLAMQWDRGCFDDMIFDDRYWITLFRERLDAHSGFSGVVIPTTMYDYPCTFAVLQRRHNQRRSRCVF